MNLAVAVVAVVAEDGNDVGLGFDVDVAGAGAVGVDAGFERACRRRRQQSIAAKYRH